VIVRDERPADVDAISAVTAAAFAGRPYSAGTEQYIVLALRRAGALVISLVAEQDGVVVGHAAWSLVSLPDTPAGWYGLGPISVSPEWQGQGIGTALMEAGLERLRRLGALGCVLVGDPAYYERFGFDHFPGLAYPGAPAEVVMALPFTSALPTGAIEFHEAFGATGPDRN